MRKYTPYKDEERPFNIAVALMQRCDALLTRANEASVNGDFHTWFFILKALKRTISFKLIEKEIKDLEEKFKEISNTLSSSYKEMSISSERSLDELETKIILLMYNCGLYYPKYQRKRWEDEAEEEDI